MEHSQEKAPPQQTEAPKMPVLQIPAHEERGRKCDREIPHLPVDLHNSLNLRGKELILHLRRKSVTNSLEAQEETEREANQCLPALSSKS